MSRTRAAIAVLLLVVGGSAAAAETEGFSVPTIRSRLAWSLLIMGDSTAALRQFTRLSGIDDSAAPRVGSALSSADLGDYAGAARAMRAALRVNPDSLAEVSLDPRLRPVVDRLAGDSIQWLAGNEGVQQDALLLLASLNYLRGDGDSARYAVDLAHAAGDHSRSADNLRRLIDELAPPPAPQPAPWPEPQDAGLPAEAAAMPAPDPAGIEQAPKPQPDLPPDPQLDTAPVAGPTPEPQPEAEPETEPETRPVSEECGPPAPEPAPVPHDPVDFEKLRSDVGTVAGTLDRFTAKLLKAMGFSQEGTEQQGHKGTE